MKLKWIIFMLSFAASPGFCQELQEDWTPVPGDEIALSSLLTKQKPGPEKAELLLRLGKIYLFSPGEEKKDLNHALSYAHQAKQMFSDFKITDGYNDAQILMAETMLESGMNDSAQLLLKSTRLQVQKALASLKPGKYPTKEMRIRRQLAFIHFRSKDYDSADNEFKAIIKFRQQHGFLNLHYTYYQMACMYLDKSDMSKALSYSLETIKSMEETSDSLAAGNFYFILGICYRSVGQFQKSIDYYEKAMIYFRKRSGPMMFQLAANTANALMKLKRPKEGIRLMQDMNKKYPIQNPFQKYQSDLSLGESYRAAGEYAMAETYYKKIFEFKLKEGTANAADYKMMGQLYVEAANYPLAKPYLEQAIKMGTHNFPPGWRAHLHFLLFKTDSAAGNYLSAIQHLMTNKALDDIVYEQTKIRENKELQIKYETEKKDRELKFSQQNIELLRRDSLLQQSVLNQAKKDRNILIAGAILLIMLLTLLYNRYQVKQKNNNQINSKNIALQQLVTEKEWLLKEVHHRVKNNLQTVVSLLESQSAYLQNDALLALQDSQNRVHAMSLVHQKLYQAENVASIDMGAYLPELISYLRDTLQTHDILFKQSVIPIFMDVSQAIPIGLIVNEAITNAVKYAFPNKQKNKEVIISLSQVSNSELILSISDNGVGIPGGFDINNSQGLGLKLMQGLTGDIEGRFSITNLNGTAITIQFTADTLLQQASEINRM